MNGNLVLDYIRATTNLYGIAPFEKIMEIYNQQNDDQICIEDLDAYIEQDLSEYYVYVYYENFVHETILEFDEFDLVQAKKGNKPYYVPEKGELLKYADMNYYETPKQYRELFRYIRKNFFPSDDEKAEMLCENIRWECTDGPDIQVIFGHFNTAGVDFKNEKQVNEVLQLVMDLANNVRLWENNGHTPHEIFEKFEKPNLGSLPEGVFPGFGDRPKLRLIQGGSSEKVGRNDPCPCGSGKKYKKCCLGKEG